MAWIYLFMASCLEICWNYSLKFLSVQKIRAIDWSHLSAEPAAWRALLPAVCYVAFGVGNVICFSMAMRQIAPSTAFAIWMGTALVGIKVVDTLVFKEAFSYYHVLYIGFILVGIIGLKRTA